MCKVYEMPEGAILWIGVACLGIKGSTLPEMFNECNCFRLSGNCFDWELDPSNRYTEEQQAFIDEALKYWSEDN